MYPDVIRALISHTGAIIEHKMFHRRPNLLKGANVRNLVASSTNAATTPLGSDSDISSYLPSSYEESVRSGDTANGNPVAGSSRRDRSNSSGLPLSHRASTRSASGTRAGSVRSNRSYSSVSAHRNSSEQSTDDGGSSAPGSREGDERVSFMLSTTVHGMLMLIVSS